MTRTWALDAALILGMLLALAACDMFRYDLGNSVEARAAKLAMRKYDQRNARKPDAPALAIPAERSTTSTVDLGVAAPYISCDSFAECRDKAQDFDRRIGWTSPDLPLGYQIELHQLRQVTSRALGFDPKDPQCHEYRAKVREALQDWDGALEDWTGVLTERPNDVPALIRRAHVQLVRGDLQNGLADTGRALTMEPDNVPALIERAAIRQRLQDSGAALADLDRVLTLQPSNVTALSARATVHTQRHEQAPALADMNRAIALEPANAGLYAQRGNVHETFDAIELARADYRRACELGDPFWCTIARR